MQNLITKDTAISIGLVLTLMGAAGWAADTNARLRTVEEKVSAIPGMRDDLATIKAKIIGPAAVTLSKP